VSADILQVITLEAEKNARRAAGNLKHSLTRQNREAEAVESSRSNVDVLSKLCERLLQILGSRSGERNDEDFRRLGAFFKQAGDASEQRRRFSRSRAREST
jgi:hypothetical protein